MVIPPPPINTPTYLRLRIQIRDDIMSGLWPLGSHLTLRGLGAHYRVSNVPVREALLQLQGDGMVDMKMNHGAVVTTVDEPWLLDFFAIRDALEDMLTRNACERHRVDQMVLMRREQQLLSQAALAQDWEAMFAAERRFSSCLHALGRNEHAASLLAPRNCLVEAFRRSRPVIGPVDAPRWAERMHHLCNAIAGGDADTACALAAQHLAGLRQHLLRLLNLQERQRERRGPWVEG